MAIVPPVVEETIGRTVNDPSPDEADGVDAVDHASLQLDAGKRQRDVGRAGDAHFEVVGAGRNGEVPLASGKASSAKSTSPPVTAISTAGASGERMDDANPRLVLAQLAQIRPG